MIGATAAQYDKTALGTFKEIFGRLPPAAAAEMHGRFRSAFVGPAWLRRSAPTMLIVGGLGGWCGKVFDEQGRGLNLVRRGGAEQQIMPVVLRERPSLVDARPTLTVVYPPGSRWPWPWIVDELRWLQEETLLGLTIVTRFGLQRFAFPFLLQRKGGESP